MQSAIETYIEDENPYAILVVGSDGALCCVCGQVYQHMILTPVESVAVCIGDDVFFSFVVVVICVCTKRLRCCCGLFFGAQRL